MNFNFATNLPEEGYDSTEHMAALFSDLWPHGDCIKEHNLLALLTSFREYYGSEHKHE